MTTILSPTDRLVEQTLGLRRMLTGVFKSIPADKADVMPPTWKNNARWHAGHMIVTPCLLTHAVAKESLPVPEEFRRWFAKGTGPADWGTDTLPAYDQLVEEVLPIMERLLESWRPRLDEPYADPYTTSLGITLRTPGEALNFSLAHDGIHLGLLLALRRSL